MLKIMTRFSIVAILTVMCTSTIEPKKPEIICGTKYKITEAQCDKLEDNCDGTVSRLWGDLDPSVVTCQCCGSNGDVATPYENGDYDCVMKNIMATIYAYDANTNNPTNAYVLCKISESTSENERIEGNTNTFGSFVGVLHKEYCWPYKPLHKYDIFEITISKEGYNTYTKSKQIDIINSSSFRDTAYLIPE